MKTAIHCPRLIGKPKMNKFFGLIPDNSYELALLSPVGLAGDRLFNTKRHYNLLPSHSQGSLPSCAGHAFSNLIEDMIITTHGKSVFARGQQIDGDAIWRYGIKSFQNNNKLSGLTLNQAFLSTIGLGIIPPFAEFRVLPRDLSRCVEVLDNTSVVIGHWVTDNWDWASRKTGYIKTSKVEKRYGHAVLLYGVANQNNEPYPMFLNSWGQNWGFKSVGMMSLGLWQASICSAPGYIEIDPKIWKNWRGWEKFIIDAK